MWRSVVEQLFPGWVYHPAADQEGYFDSYRQAVNELNNPGGVQNGYAPALLAVSERIYDSEVSRREATLTQRDGCIAHPAQAHPAGMERRRDTENRYPDCIGPPA